MRFLTCTMPVQSPLCGPKAPTKSWPASPASPSARQMPRPHNLCHEPLLQDTRHRCTITRDSIGFPQRRNMKILKLSVNVLALLAAGTLAGCSGTAAKSPDVSDSIRKSLDQAGLKDVSVSQDRDKGIVTLGGQVASENDKSQAESLAKSLAGTQVVADQIAVIQNKLHDNVKYEVKSGVVTLSGEVNSQYKRARAEKVAIKVLNVKQVVNDLQIKNQKASSSY